MNTSCPVIFIVYNRPNHARRVLEKIREFRPQHLYIIADGPKKGDRRDRNLCSETREVLDTCIDWPCRIYRDFASENLGCRLRVQSGISAAFQIFPEAVILEDDCLPDPSFFHFCAELLERYRNEVRVLQVSGCSHGVRSLPMLDSSYVFSRYPQCWGWATWRRSWIRYNYGMESWGDTRSRRNLLSIFENDAEMKYWTKAFDRVAYGKIDTWDYQWVALAFATRCLTVIPSVNLVTNIGFGNGATHTTVVGELADIPSAAIPFPLIHPDLVDIDHEADRKISAKCYREPSLFARGAAKLRAWGRL